jgi:hypothetical protein
MATPPNYPAVLFQNIDKLPQWYRARKKHLTSEARRLGQAPIAEQLAHWLRIPPGTDPALSSRLLGAIPDFSIRFLLDPESVRNRKTPTGFNLETLSSACNSGVWTGHGLSAEGDSIALLADLGRVLRLGAALQARKRQVVVAGPNWAGYSAAAIKSGAPGRLLNDNLRWRKRIYQLCGFNGEIEVWDHVNSGSSTGPAIDADKLDARIRSAIGLAKHLVGNAFSQGSFDAAELAKLEAWLACADGRTAENLKNLGVVDNDQCILKDKWLTEQAIRAVAREWREDIVILSSVAGYFIESLSGVHSRFEKALEAGLKYLLSQVDMQSSKRGSLKVGPETEVRFDTPFNELGGVGDPLATVYFRHYQFGDTRVLPYTALSIDLSRSTSENETGLDRIIMISDVNEPDKAKIKIAAILRKTNRLERANLLADLTSFTVHALLRADRSSEVARRLQAVDEQMHQACLKALENEASIADDAHRLLTEPHMDSVPYWVMPWLWGDGNWAEKMDAVVEFIIEISQAVRAYYRGQ